MKIQRLRQFACVPPEINHQCSLGLLRATPAAEFFSNGKFDFQQNYKYSALHRSHLDALETLIAGVCMKIENHNSMISITTEFHIFPRNNFVLSIM